jgi:hypothetical protein
MAQPSSSHHDRDYDRERERRHRSSSSHHHHRTISSTTLLLVLSLILAVLAVMLSMPAGGFGSSSAAATGANADDPATPNGVLSIFNPKRAQQLIARETAVALREAEVARREAELLAGAPGGVIQNAPPPPIACPVCPMPEPPQTIIKEVVKEEALVPPNWWKEAGARADDIIERELRMADREREISKREEAVNRREHDASRRESWIMEQLVYVLISHWISALLIGYIVSLATLNLKHMRRSMFMSNLSCPSHHHLQSLLRLLVKNAR